MNDFVRHIRKCNLTLADDVIITCDNVKQLGEFIGVRAIKRVMYYNRERGYKLYSDLIRDIIYEKQPYETFSDGYDIASEAICFLCENIGKPLGRILAVNSKGKELNIRDICFKTVFRYIYGNQKYESNIADLEEPNLIEMSMPFESESMYLKMSNNAIYCREKQARKKYRETKNIENLKNELFILDIIREGMKQNDPRLR